MIAVKYSTVIKFGGANKRSGHLPGPRHQSRFATLDSHRAVNQTRDTVLRVQARSAGMAGPSSSASVNLILNEYIQLLCVLEFLHGGLI